jgi:hypothetical protein
MNSNILIYSKIVYTNLSFLPPMGLMIALNLNIY